MISYTNKYIFIHIPKVAGSSIKDVLKTTEYQNERSVIKNGPDCFNVPPPHLAAKHYLKYDIVTKEQFDSYFKFAFVRNPFDRLVSEFKYRRYPINMTFKEFVFKFFPKPNWSDYYCHIIPQYEFLYDEDGSQLVDFIGKFESLEADFNQILKILNIEPVRLPKLNKANHIIQTDNSIIKMLQNLHRMVSINYKRNTFSHYSEYYDDETISKVSEIYKKDIETFDYTFQVKK